MDFYIQQLIKRDKGNIHSASMNINRLKTIRDIVHASQYSSNPIVRNLPDVRNEMSGLKRNAEAKIDMILKQQFKEINESTEDKTVLFNQYERQHWMHLRGNFPNHYHQVLQFKMQLQKPIKAIS